MNKLNKTILVISSFGLLCGCTYPAKTATFIYNNTFSPWPVGVDYMTFISGGTLNVTYQNEYNYLLSYKNGSKVEDKGTYKFENETFYLIDENGGTTHILTKRNYYEFNEIITHESKEYTIIWHAQYIFD